MILFFTMESKSSKIYIFFLHLPDNAHQLVFEKIPIVGFKNNKYLKNHFTLQCQYKVRKEDLANATGIDVKFLTWKKTLLFLTALLMRHSK